MTYSIDNRWCDGKIVKGEWVLIKDRSLTGAFFYDPVLAHRVAETLNAVTDEQRKRIDAEVYRKAVVLGEKVA